MKKIFALALAAVMTAGMTTVAFAKNEETPSLDKAGMFVLDDGEVKKEFEKAKDFVEGGDEIAIPVALLNEAGSGYSWYTIDSEFDKKLVLNEDWDVNKADTDFRFVKYAKGVLNSEKALRVYSVIITVPENDTNKVADLVGSVQVGKTRSEAKDADKTDVSISIAPAAKDVTPFKEADFSAGKTGIVSFSDEDGEIDIEFGNDTAMFTVDVTGQGKLNLAWNTDFDSEIADLDKSANMDFIIFEGEPSFNKNGTLYIYAEDDTFLYQVVDGKLKAVKADYNEDYEAWELKTRKLGRYVISDKEIDLDKVNTEVEDKNESSKPETGKDNPDTGR